MKSLPLGLKILFLIDILSAALLALLSVWGIMASAARPDGSSPAAHIAMMVCSVVFLGAFAALFFFAAMDILRHKAAAIKKQGGANYLFALAAMGIWGMGIFLKRTQNTGQEAAGTGIFTLYQLTALFLLLFVAWSFVYLRLPGTKKSLDK